MALHRTRVQTFKTGRKMLQKKVKTVQGNEFMYKSYHLVKEGKPVMQDLMKKSNIKMPRIDATRISEGFRKSRNLQNLAEVTIKNLPLNRQQNNAAHSDLTNMQPLSNTDGVTNTGNN